MSDGTNPIPRVNGKLPTFAEAALMKRQQMVEETVRAIFYHFNKHRLAPIECGYALAGSYQMIKGQLHEDERAGFEKMFKELLDKKQPEENKIIAGN